MALAIDHELVASVAGTNITSAYTASSAIPIGRNTRMQFHVRVVTQVGSGLTTVTVKLQHRYHGSVAGVETTLGYVDLPSDKGDASKTFEVEHAFTVAANQTNDFAFFLADARALSDITVNVKANTTGSANDSVKIYAKSAA